MKIMGGGPWGCASWDVAWPYRHRNCWILLWYTWEITVMHWSQRALGVAPACYDDSWQRQSPYWRPNLWLVMALRLGGSGLCSQQFRSLTLLHLFGTLDMHLAGKRFAPDADTKQAATSWLQVLDTDLFYPGIQSLVPRWDSCLNVSCDCWKVSCVPSSIDVDMGVRIKFLASGCLLPNFLKLARAQVYFSNPDLSCDCHRLFTVATNAVLCTLTRLPWSQAIWFFFFKF